MTQRHARQRDNFRIYAKPQYEGNFFVEIIEVPAENQPPEDARIMMRIVFTGKNLRQNCRADWHTLVELQKSLMRKEIVFPKTFISASDIRSRGDEPGGGRPYHREYEYDLLLNKDPLTVGLLTRDVRRDLGTLSEVMCQYIEQFPDRQ